MNTTAEDLIAELDRLGTERPFRDQGKLVAQERAAVVDDFLRDLFDDIGYPSGVALVALGGYGRGELAPGSDIDLLLLHAGVDGIDRLAERIFYPLWDAKLTVGHAVRTVDECVVEARGRLDVLASMLDARRVAGAEWLIADMHEGVFRLAAGDPAGFAARLREDMRLRHATYASVSHHLEPDLKEGAGGLRDVHSLGWLAKVSGEPALAANPDVLEAESFLVTLRSALQLATGRRTDKLYLEQQPELAAAFGYQDQPQWTAPDLLMRDVFKHGRAVAFAVSSAFAGYLGEHQLVPSPASLTEGSWTRAACADFFALLRSGDIEAIEALDREGLLERLFPEWADVRYRPQRDPYHRFTVDTHLLECARAMSILLAPRAAGDQPGEPMANQAAAVVAQAGPDAANAVLLGALLHDIGKVGKRGHVTIGAGIARDVTTRMDLSPEARDLVGVMVEQHLLLPDTATRRDLADERLVVDVAAKIERPERLAALYLLSQADAEATGPNASTPWRQTLIRELVAKVQHVMDRGDAGSDTAEQLATAAEAIRGALEGEDAARVDAFLLRVPAAYVLSVSPAQAALDFPLLAAPIGATEVRTVARPGARAGTFALTVVAADRPGLLARVAGALSLSRFSIQSAQVFTTEDAMAVDHFEVIPAFSAAGAGAVGEEEWRKFRTTLRKALEGRLSLDYRVKEKREHYPPPRRGVPIDVRVENDASDFYSIIEVGAADRTGLLYDITRTLFDLSLDVHIAKVSTYGDRVIDAFYVRDVLGQKITDDEHAEEVVRAITARLSE